MGGLADFVQLAFLFANGLCVIYFSGANSGAGYMLERRWFRDGFDMRMSGCRTVSVVCAVLAFVGLHGKVLAEALPSYEMDASVRIVGAVRSPGEVRIPMQLSLDRVIDLAGGLLPSAYRFGAVVLRVSEAQDSAVPCVPPAAFQAITMIADDPLIRGVNGLISALQTGQMRRIDAADARYGALFDDAPAAVIQPGDVVAIPSRTSKVFVAVPGSSALLLNHESGWAADDYLRQPEVQPLLGDWKEFALYYPNGRSVTLSIDHWRYQDTAVPPGAMIAPARVACFYR